MRKLFVLLLSLLTVLSLCGCASDTGSDNLAEYSVDGFSIMLPKDMVSQLDETDKTFAMFVGNEKSAMTVASDELQILLDGGYISEDTLMEDYVALMEEYNGITFEKNDKGDYVSTYTEEMEDGTYSYYVTLRQGEQYMWVVNLFCEAANEAECFKDFATWAETIKVK